MSRREGFGWELMLKTVERDIKEKSDLFVVIVHWMLIRRGFSCLGIGPERKDDDVPSETLPSDWNESDSTTLKYTYQDNLYNLHKFTCNNNVIFNLINVSDLSTSNVTLNPDWIVKTSGPLEEMLSEFTEISYKINNQLVEPVTLKPTKEMETQTERSRSPDIGTSLDSFLQPLRDAFIPESPLGPLRVTPRDIGRSDLDPFGNGRGGMLFDPFHGPHGSRPPINPGFGGIGGIPRGSVPPGARFDPIGPMRPGPMNPRRPPDNDHLPPPGFDDMFM